MFFCNYLIIFNLSIVVISSMCTLYGHQVEYKHETSSVPILFYNVDDKVVIKDLFSYSIPNTIENRALNSALSGFKELSLSAGIGAKLAAKGDWEISINSHNLAYKESNFLDNINSMQLSFTDNFKNSLNTHGTLISTIDLSTSDATTEQINILLNGAKSITTLVLPFSASYDSSRIQIPKTLKNLVIYNQSITKNLLNYIFVNSSISEIVFWGCVFNEDFSIYKNTNSNSLKSVTILNCNSMINNSILNYKFPNLESIFIDDFNTLGRIVSIDSIQMIKFFTHRVRSTNKTGQEKKLYIQEVVDRAIISNRDQKAKNLTVIISSVDI